MTTMICPSCGFENPKGMKFCGHCATLLANRCPSCGFENPPEFKFCGECATSLSRDSHVAVTPEIAPSLEPTPSAGFSKQDPKATAMEAAREWTRSSIDSVAQMLGLAVTEGTPVLQNAASSLIRNQIKQKVEWTYSEPGNLAEDRYRVIATGSAPLQIGLLTHKWKATVSADFELLIDTMEKRLTKWKMVPQSFKVISSEETERLRERVGEEVEKAKGKLRDFSTDEG